MNLINRDSEEYTEEYLDRFFPGPRVKLKSNDDISLFEKYRRPNGNGNLMILLVSTAPWKGSEWSVHFRRRKNGRKGYMRLAA